LRVDAGLNADHRLVTAGPYRVVRLAVALLVFVAGTEIRVRIEDGLLASRFGEQFADFRRRMPAYVPFVR
jgi:protein-S-isoprenylcysteine O-methyltransferase Ste14